MKPKLNSLLVLLALSSAAHGATQYASNPGTWNLTNLNWSAAATTGGPYTSLWANVAGDIAVFEGTAGAVTVGASMNAAALTFNTTGYSLSATSAFNLTSNVAATVNVASGVTAAIGTNVTVKSSAASQSWTLSGTNKATSILDLTGTITATTNNSQTIRDITVNVNSGGLLNSGSSIVVGSATTGSGSILNISGGTLTIGSANAAAALILNNTGGIAANTSLTLTTGGAITFAANSTTNGLRFGPTGTISAVGTNLVGTFNLDGGTLTTNKIFMGSSTYTGGAVYNATFNFNGGTLKALATNNTDFLGALRGTGYLVKSGGAKIDSNGKDITIAQPLLDGTGGGGLTKEGLGTLTLTGANTYTGSTTINGGTLRVVAPGTGTAPITAPTINSSGRLGVTTGASQVSVPGTVTVNTDGGFEANVGTYNASNVSGLSLGTLDALGNYKIDLTGSVIPVCDITVLTYTTKTGSGTPSVGTLPQGCTATVEETASAIILHILTPSGIAYAWSRTAASTGDWDTSSLNWNSPASAYSEATPAYVSFPAANYGTVTVTDTRTPYSLNIASTTPNDYTITGTGKITGSTGVTKTGSGIVTFTNTGNDYSGATTISAGAIVKATADTTSGAIAVADAASLGLSTGITAGSGQTLTLSGPGVAANIVGLGTITSRGALQSVSGNNTWAGNIILTGTAGIGGNTRIGVQNGATLTLNGNISEGTVGMSPLFRAGNSLADSITINGLGSWTGTTRLFSEGGAIKLGGNDRFPTTAPLSAGSSASVGISVFDLAGYSQTVAGLTGDATGRIQNSGGASILTSNPAVAATFAGIMQDNVSFVIGGTAIQTLSGANTYTGNTTVNSGGALTLSTTGQLRFKPTTNGVTNSVGGDGTALVNGKFVVDLTAATVANGNTWTLLNKGTLSATISDTTFGIETSAAVAFTDPENDGTWTLVDGSNTWSFKESDGKLSVAIAATGYAAWQLANASDQTVDQDHDYDGVKNGIEYFMGESGNGFTANPPVVGNTVTWPMGATYTGTYGTDYTVQTSSDLNTWTPATVGVGAGFVTITPATSVIYTLPTGSGKLFVRLLVNPN